MRVFTTHGCAIFAAPARISDQRVLLASHVLIIPTSRPLAREGASHHLVAAVLFGALVLRRLDGALSEHRRPGRFADGDETDQC